MSFNVLVVDDDATLRAMFTSALASRGYEVVTASSGQDALASIASRRPDAVLLDIFMPRMSGLDVLGELRGKPETQSLPVILVSALGDIDHIVRGLNEGANDYVTKPLAIPILLARVEAILRGAAMVRKLEVQAELLSRLAAYDELTEVCNRRSFFLSLETEIGRCRRYKRALSLLMVDVDHFKKVNDEHGHPTGDAVLREFANRVKRCIRLTDTLFRYGGEEFAVILPDTDLANSRTPAERIRSAVEGDPFVVAEHRLAITTSVGVASWSGQGAVPDLVGAADSALYAAKRDGRNRVSVAAPP
jgi:two-component system, cell cycle response regulator